MSASDPLLEFAYHQTIGYILLIIVEVVGPEPSDAIHSHFLPVLVLLYVHQNAGQLARRQKPPKTIEDLLQVLGLAHQLLLNPVELLN